MNQIYDSRPLARYEIASGANYRLRQLGGP